MKLKRNIFLALLSTIRLGGRAEFFSECKTIADLKASLDFGKQNNFRTHILGEGSNTLFADDGFDGLVIKIALEGIKIETSGDNVLVTAAAGENWDKLVERTVESQLTGIEALSGIPGTVGATPIQNVGAYGQEVSQTIVSVKALDRQTLKLVQFNNRDCQFSYRCSRFKTIDKDRYIIVAVVFRLKSNKAPQINYNQVAKRLKPLKSPMVVDIRRAVLALRREKSMVLDEKDPNSRSLGSFFINPIISTKKFRDLTNRYQGIPYFENGENIKIPAAWLVEQAGFYKGYQENGVGISENHALALINIHGSTKSLLDLASKIGQKVEDQFGIKLAVEPEIVS